MPMASDSGVCPWRPSLWAKGAVDESKAISTCDPVFAASVPGPASWSSRVPMVTGTPEQAPRRGARKMKGRIRMMPLCGTGLVFFRNKMGGARKTIIEGSLSQNRLDTAGVARARVCDSKVVGTGFGFTSSARADEGFDDDDL